MKEKNERAESIWKTPEMEVRLLHKRAETPEEKKEQSLAGYHLLYQMVQERYGCQLEAERNPIAQREKGKPYLRFHPGLHFNISHSGEWVICALGSVEVGIDIQYHRKIQVEKTAEKICNPTERSQMDAASDAARKQQELFRIWTKKESYLKYTGEGIRRDLRELTYKGCRFYPLEVPEGYTATLCISDGCGNTFR